MKRTIFLCSLVFGAVFTVGMLVSNSVGSLPGREAEGAVDELFAGELSGPCEDQELCSADISCSQDPRTGSCVKVGEFCGTCTGDVHNRRCSGDNPELSCTQYMVPRCCSLTSVCVTIPPTPINPNNSCDCQKSRVIGDHGFRWLCFSPAFYP